MDSVDQRNKNNMNGKYDVENLKSLRLEKQALGFLLKSEENLKVYFEVSRLLTDSCFADKYNKQILTDFSTTTAAPTVPTVPYFSLLK